MTPLAFLLSLRPALPMSIETPCTEASNSEVRRWIDQNAVLCNGTALTKSTEIEFPVTSLVLFPRSAVRRTTLF